MPKLSVYSQNSRQHPLSRRQSTPVLCTWPIFSSPILLQILIPSRVGKSKQTRASELVTPKAKAVKPYLSLLEGRRLFAQPMTTQRPKFSTHRRPATPTPIYAFALEKFRILVTTSSTYGFVTQRRSLSWRNQVGVFSRASCLSFYKRYPSYWASERASILTSRTEKGVSLGAFRNSYVFESGTLEFSIVLKNGHLANFILFRDFIWIDSSKLNRCKNC